VTVRIKLISHVHRNIQMTALPTTMIVPGKENAARLLPTKQLLPTSTAILQRRPLGQHDAAQPTNIKPTTPVRFSSVSRVDGLGNCLRMQRQLTDLNVTVTIEISLFVAVSRSKCRSEHARQHGSCSSRQEEATFAWRSRWSCRASDWTTDVGADDRKQSVAT
jgi:hypothetical protein